ncbi:winged helix DNA-binding domain-containing protein [Actinoplanes bogorensis]|uniref:Winged helix DNA-binding domain-containing protein n=1 Tax=Paractinoplanes bogorensis TaxID=1610840 RepID=A0ABS5YPX8_9ACTN|nr:crosslink repair DNA glycosylase YcaQ family protein [Actinoplanes bogorensis]MBU2665501.1 winged helix DNA-binding domain-containing protein [Actinoplanes bogorensis]
MELTAGHARRIWLRAQRLDTPEPFGAGPEAVAAAVRHLGYVQIDTIHVIERAHHHILFSRVPGYRRADLQQAQSTDKSVFETWTHALSYAPAEDLRFFLPRMRELRTGPWLKWHAAATPQDVRRVVARVRGNGPLTIRDITDDVLVDKDWLWASRKPSKLALEIAFSWGLLTVSRRDGMVKTYELMDRHFGWTSPPRPATGRQQLTYRLDRALRAQGVVSLASICFHRPNLKPTVRALLEQRVRRRELVPVSVAGVEHWAAPDTLDASPAASEAVHLLSPFDPLIIQRERLERFFGYRHVFEAYLPKAKRRYGYFALPVLVGDRVVAVLDLKTDRAAGKLLVQQWTRTGDPVHRAAIEAALDRFERFQLAGA